MVTSSVETAVLKALDQWQSQGKPPQRGFKWNNRKATWANLLPQHEAFLLKLPRELDRNSLRRIVGSTDSSHEEKFLAVMLWGFAGIGYGAFRCKRMIDSANFSSTLQKLSEFSMHDDFLGGYELLAKAEIAQLGPSYATKLLSFVFPERPGVPILDSVIADYLGNHGVVEFVGGAKRIDTWNSSLFTFYVESMRDIAAKFEISANDVELAIYNDS